jgi:hypothetical protein
VPEQTHFPLQCQAGAGDHDGPGAHEIDQRAKRYYQPGTERDQGQQVSVVGDDNVIEHQLEADRDGKAERFEDQGHHQHLGRCSSKPMSATQQIPDPDPRALSLPLKALGGPSFEYVVNDHAAPANPG